MIRRTKNKILISPAPTYNACGQPIRLGITHDLKVWPEPFCALINDIKPFEVRKNDRDFQVGDVLILKEWDPASESYTGQSCTRRVEYLLKGGQFGIEAGFVVMGISKW